MKHTELHLKGEYDLLGNLTLGNEGSVNIVVQVSYQNNQKIAVVYIGGAIAGQVTFGLSGQRVVSTFLQGFDDNTTMSRNIENIILASGC